MSLVVYSTQKRCKACLQIQELADKYASPVVVENLDFGKKKEQLREEGHFSYQLSVISYQ